MSAYRKHLISLLVCGMLLFTGCLGAGAIINDDATIAFDGTEHLAAQLIMDAGAVTVKGGTGALVEADFAYSVEDWKPDVRYTALDSTGTLILEQGSGTAPFLARPQNEWVVKFAENVTLDLNITLGAGSGNFDLGDLAITSFSLDMGAGAVAIDFDGMHSGNVSANIEGGAGSLTITIPDDVGARIEIEKTIGIVDADDFNKQGVAYTNNAYGTTDGSLHIYVKNAVGTIHLVRA